MKRPADLLHATTDATGKQDLGRDNRASGFADRADRADGANGRGAVAAFMDACFDTLLDFAPSNCIQGSLQMRHARVAHAFRREGRVTEPVLCREHLAAYVRNADEEETILLVEAGSEPEEMPRQVTRGRSGGVHRLRLTLRHEETTVAAFELERSEIEPPFSCREREQIERLGYLVTNAVVAQIDFMDAQCELAVLRSVGPGHKTYLLFDRNKATVLWGSEQARPLNWSRDVEPCERSIVNSAESLLVAQTGDDVLPTPMPGPFGLLVAASLISTETPFGSGCAVMGFRLMAEGGGVIMQLSEQERMVARLLVRGYQPLNIGALTGISEHTVRTYIRRIYKKLRVSSRADLVRMLLTEV
jgi:DNA-binding CsgD family transcriptional regulator